MKLLFTSCLLILVLQTVVAQKTKHAARLTISQYLPLLHGLWVRKDYLESLVETHSVTKSSPLAMGTVTLRINKRNRKGNTLNIKESVNNHEGQDFDLYLTPHLSSLKTGSTGNGRRFELNMADTSLISSEFDKKNILVSKLIFKKLESNLSTVGDDELQFLVNKTVLAGRYFKINETGNVSTPVTFNSNGSVSGLSDFRYYTLQYDLIMRPKANESIDRVIFTTKDKKTVVYTFIRNGGQLTLTDASGTHQPDIELTELKL